MPVDIDALLADRSDEKYDLYDRHLNTQMVRMLKTIGFDRHYVRGAGAYLYDREDNRYLDLLSGFGVFAVGRNHPAVIGALHQTLDAELPNLVQMDVSLLSGLLAERLLKLLPGMEKMFFCNSGAEAVAGAMKFARAPPATSPLSSSSRSRARASTSRTTTTCATRRGCAAAMVRCSSPMRSR